MPPAESPYIISGNSPAHMAHRTVPKENVTEGAASIDVHNQLEESSSLHGRVAPMTVEQAGAETWEVAEKTPVRAFPAIVGAAAPMPVTQASADVVVSDREGTPYRVVVLLIQPDNPDRGVAVPTLVLQVALAAPAPKPVVRASREAGPFRRAWAFHLPTRAWPVALAAPGPRLVLEVAYPGQRKTPACNSLEGNELTEARPRASQASAQRTGKVPPEEEAPALLPVPELSGQTPLQDWLMQTFSSLYLLTTSIHSNRPSDGSHVVAF